ncbi:MAG: glycosyltransferase [Anaerolineales bacterium]|nr:glycosyltransferase [Anaerolineales bacterium]
MPLPRRVAMLSYHTCPLARLGGQKTGGMNVYVRDFSQALADAGVQVDVFTRLQPGCEPVVNHELGPNCRVIHIPAGPDRLVSVAEMENYLDEFTAGVVAFAAAEGVQYDLIHSHYWLSGLIGERLRAVWPGAPLVQMFHTLGHMKNAIARSESEFASRQRLDGETHLVQVADRLIAATPAEEEQLIELYGADPGRIAVVPPGVDLARFQPIPRETAMTSIGIPPWRKNILFAGRIEPLKGIDTLLQALAILQTEAADKLDNVCVTIVGGDPWTPVPDSEMERLQTLSHELGLHDLVAFAGARDQDLLPYYFAAAEMVVVPSHYESFGMVALESMAMGTPVIASRVGGLAHLVVDGCNGFLVPAGDPTMLAARILDVLDCPGCRDELSHFARAYAQSYAWPKIVERMLRVYAGVLAETSLTR